MSDIILGIDLGTTNSVVAVADGQQVTVLADEAGNRLIPSVVSFHPEGRILVGEEARERRLIDARNTVYSIKRLIGRPFRSDEVRTAKSRFAFDLTASGSGGVVVKVRDETYTLTEISAFVLREVRRIAEARLGESVSRAVITVPANFNELQRSATKAAGRVAGLEVARIINEPTAAALAYGYGKTRAERVAVYDLGGGTFDLTLLELEGDVFEVIGTAGDSFLGGDDIDLIITEEMASQFLQQHRYDPRQDAQAFERLRAAAEWAKCQLSEQSAIELTVEELAYGDGGRALDLAFTMSRAALEEKIQPIVGKSFDVCNDALRDAGMRPKDVDSVILVGGSTRIPLVRQMVEQFFGKSPRTDIDPDLVVAQGAAIHAMALAGPRRGKARQSLGKVKLRKMTLNDLREAQAKRKSRQETLPKQPAFAPNTQLEAPPRPNTLSAAISAKPLAPGERPSSPVDEEGATGAVASRSIAVGQRKKSRTLLGLDDPTGRSDETGQVVTDRAPVQPRPRSSTLTGREDTGELVTSAMSPGRSRVVTASGLPTDDPVQGIQRKRVQTANLLDLDEPEPSSGDFQLGVSKKPMSPGRARQSTAQFGTGSGAKRPVTVPGGLTPPSPQELDEPPQSGTTASGVAAPRGPVAPPPPARRARPIPKAPPKPPPLAPRPAPPPVAKAGQPARPKPAPPSLPPRANITGTQPIGVDDLELVDEALSEAPPAHIIDDHGFDDDDEATAMFDASQMPSLTDDLSGLDSEMTLTSGDIELDGPDADGLELTDAATAAMAGATMMQGGDAAPNVIVAPNNPQPLALGDSLAAGAPPLASTLQAPAAAQVSTPVLDIREGTETPLLMDVTPLALGLEMAGGYCQHLIRRNAPIPAEQSRVFTTASDGQAEVEVRICQGDSRVYTENQALGEVVLSGLRDAARGAVRIEVTFILDASGTLDVQAKDVDTGQAQKTRINLLGGVSDDEIAAMQARQQAALSR